MPKFALFFTIIFWINLIAMQNMGFKMWKWTYGLSLLAVVLFFNACTSDDELPPPRDFLGDPHELSSEVVADWYGMFLEVSRYADGYRPPITARNLGYIGLAGYETIAHATPGRESLSSHFDNLDIPRINDNELYYWPAAINAAYQATFKYFFPHVASEYDAMIDHMYDHYFEKYSAMLEGEVMARSEAFGKAVAAAVINWSQLDQRGDFAFLNPTPPYDPPVGPGLWQPTPPDFLPGLVPEWGKVRQFAISEEDKLSPPPLEWSQNPNSQFYAQALEVVNTVNTLSFDQRWIGEFWSDDNFSLTIDPACRWVAIALQAMEKRTLTLAEAAELMAKLGMALADAGIAIWHSKYYYNLQRPIDYIRELMNPEWETICYNPITGDKGKSPHFPAYPSGHAGFGSAAAEVLIETFGFNFAMWDRTHEGRTEFLGMPRHFNSFNEMAVENAESRIYLGVHFRIDADEGLRMGRVAGRSVLNLPWQG
ncbi:MAG: phosphatase PAP2 family protein [Saprospirales bacterium]|nr:MAG: phosphatase PAP2 family protein [Saprospirales bacterium]